mgnify:CR=1 FL=1|tara:strand:- start:422 stop:709 length:288 start_codon:yes stop_codon:yes gene_type:complete
MNIKILKIIVIFFGILIIFGLIILTIGIYHKFNNLKKNSINSNIITLKRLNNQKVKDFYVNNEHIVVNYELNNKNIIYIYDIYTGKEIKKIELLK